MNSTIPSNLGVEMIGVEMMNSTNPSNLGVEKKQPDPGRARGPFGGVGFNASSLVSGCGVEGVRLKDGCLSCIPSDPCTEPWASKLTFCKSKEVDEGSASQGGGEDPGMQMRQPWIHRVTGHTELVSSKRSLN